MMGRWRRLKRNVIAAARLTREGVEAFGNQSRIVMPDGIKAQHLRYTSRGDKLHAVSRTTWYAATLDNLLNPE
jgi:hypothetical protein